MRWQCASQAVNLLDSIAFAVVLSRGVIMCQLYRFCGGAVGRRDNVSTLSLLRWCIVWNLLVALEVLVVLVAPEMPRVKLERLREQ